MTKKAKDPKKEAQRFKRWVPMVPPIVGTPEELARALLRPPKKARPLTPSG